MSSPKSALGGGFNVYATNMGLGYSRPQTSGDPAAAPHLRTRSRSPARVSVHGVEPLTANDPGSFAKHRLRRGLSCTDIHMLE